MVAKGLGRSDQQKGPGVVCLEARVKVNVAHQRFRSMTLRTIALLSSERPGRLQVIGECWPFGGPMSLPLVKTGTTRVVVMGPFCSANLVQSKAS
jgi:hypothetical protein